MIKGAGGVRRTKAGSAVPADGVFLRQELRPGALITGRALIAVYGLLALINYLRWLPPWVGSQINLARHAAATSATAYPYLELTCLAAAMTVLAAVAWFSLSGLVLLRRSRDLFGLMLASGLLSFGFVMGTFNDTGGVIALGQPDWWAPPWPAIVLTLANAWSLPWAFCFPDGRFVPRWTIALAAVWIAVWFLIGTTLPALTQTALVRVLLAVLIPTLVAAPLGALAYRYWNRSNAVERQQLKWIFLGTLVFIVLYLLIVPTGALQLHQNPSSSEFFFRTLHSAIFSLAVIAIPVTIGISIFRQGLLDIDLIINRTLAYGALTAALALGFLVLSRLSNAVLEGMTGQRSDLVLLASVVPVALAFMPARARVLKIADRFVSEHRVMTLLFVDIVSSTDRAYAIGDRAWRELLERFRSSVRRCIKRCHGREIDTTGDGFFVTFEAPEQAVRCARQMIAAVRPLGLEIRVGVHIGEVEVDGRHVEGGNVHLAARVTAAAGAGEVMVSEAAHQVLAGTEVVFEDRGVHELKGVPEPVHLYSARL